MSTPCCLNVKDYGATGDGATDDSAAIQKAIDVAEANEGRLFLPPGTYLVSSLILTVSENIEIFGVGPFASILKAGLPDKDLLTVYQSGVHIHSLGFKTSVPRTAGSFVNFLPSSGQCLLDNFHMEQAHVGVTCSSAAALFIEHGTFYGSSGLPGSCGILVNGGNDHYLRCLTMNNEAGQSPSAGIRIEQTGCINISDCDIINCENDLLILGGDAIYVRDSYFDSARCGIRILATLGEVKRCHFIGCWTCGHKEHGFLVEPGSTQPIEDITLLGHQASFNTFTGVYLANGSHLKVEGSTCRQNGQYGIALISPVDYVLLLGNDTTNNTKQGIVGIVPHDSVGNNLS